MIQLVKQLNRRQVGMFLFSLVFIVAQVWLDLKMPEYMSAITALVQTPGSAISDILLNGGYMLLCAVGSMAAAMITGYFAAKIAAGLSKTLREKVFKKVMRMGSEEMEKFSTSSLITRTTNDITQVQMIVSLGLQAVIKAPILLVWAVLKIAGKQWQWSLATAGAVLIIMIVLAIAVVLALPKFKVIQELTDNLNRVTRENLTGIRVVRAYNAEQHQENKFEQANEALTHTNLFANRVMGLLNPTMTFVTSGISLAIYWIGAYLINAAGMMDRLTLFSDMVAFSSYAMQVIMAFTMLTMMFIMLPRVMVSVYRINEVVNSGISIADGSYTGVPRVRGEVEFRNVSFRYPGAGDDVLHNISFTARSGETVALIGSTGSGKSTLINLIPRFYDATQGEVLVDGVNVKEYEQRSLRNRLGYVSQRATLFSGSVQSNVTYGDNGVQNGIDGQMMTEAIDIAQASGFVLKMKGKYSAPIAQGGMNVSGGQKQRLSIARAIYRRPEIFIFDDSFSALDYKTDRDLRAQLATKLKSATKIIVAQRIGTIRNADKIIVLEDGRIAGMGKHDELMKNCAVYQDIARSQLSEEELANA